MPTAVQRRLPIGAEPVPGGVHFRVWAPQRQRVDVVLDGSRPVQLDREMDGYFGGSVERAKHGTLYRFRLDSGDQLYPDPASRFQPEGPHGSSQIIDASLFPWRDDAWEGVRIEGQILYEMHIGTFTKEGTWRAAAGVLPDLAEIGITLLEIMPVAEFPGTFGWGYDGVDLFAPFHLYGTPDDFRAFVNRAHHERLGVILDVVYNHVGPDGNYLKEFSENYFTTRYENEWGEPINFDGSDSGPVREFFVSNARYWIDEFHLDGLRLDATQQIFDASSENIVKRITREARRAAGSRSIVIVGENERQDARLVRDYGTDAIWNDDFHHAAKVAATGHNEAYYSDYCGTPQEFISAVKWGFLYQGQYYSWQRKTRGSYALDLKPASFVIYTQNHDQIANSAFGSRLHELTTPGRYKALGALMLLAPNTPMLFQGQEYCASAPFLYFADHNTDLAPLVAEGRADFLNQFPGIAYSHSHFASGAPHERNTFEKCKLDPAERRRNTPMLEFHKDLLKLRREDPIFRAQRSDWIHGAVLGPEAFVLRFFGEEHGDRLILVNLGRDLRLTPVPEPLLAPPKTGRWEMVWSSDDPKYGGIARPPVKYKNIWNIPGHCTVVMSDCGGGL